MARRNSYSFPPPVHKTWLAETINASGKANATGRIAMQVSKALDRIAPIAGNADMELGDVDAAEAYAERAREEAEKPARKPGKAVKVKTKHESKPAPATVQPVPVTPQIAERFEREQIPNGIFTLESPTGQHRTLRVQTWKADKDKQPKRSLGLLTGPDNTSDYKDFAFVNACNVFVWKRFQSGDNEDSGMLCKIATVFESMMVEGQESRFYKKGMRIKESRHCMRCNRRLTTPESIASGIGPECAGKWGM